MATKHFVRQIHVAAGKLRDGISDTIGHSADLKLITVFFETNLHVFRLHLFSFSSPNCRDME